MPKLSERIQKFLAPNDGSINPFTALNPKQVNPKVEANTALDFLERYYRIFSGRLFTPNEYRGQKLHGGIFDWLTGSLFYVLESQTHRLINHVGDKYGRKAPFFLFIFLKLPLNILIRAPISAILAVACAIPAALIYLGVKVYRHFSQKKPEQSYVLAEETFKVGEVISVTNESRGNKLRKNFTIVDELTHGLSLSVSKSPKRGRNGRMPHEVKLGTFDQNTKLDRYTKIVVNEEATKKTTEADLSRIRQHFQYSYFKPADLDNGVGARTVFRRIPQEEHNAAKQSPEKAAETEYLFLP